MIEFLRAIYFSKEKELPLSVNLILWLNPSDNQGVRFILDEVRAKIAWEDSKDEDRWH